jgi:hypothetical protein
MHLRKVEIMIGLSLVFWALGSAAAVAALLWLVELPDPLSIAVDVLEDLLLTMSRPLGW